MSGGVDSSVVAALLLERGYEVVGATIEPFDLDKYFPEEKRICNAMKGSPADAKEVCAALGIEHVSVNFSEKFSMEVVDYFVGEYFEGRTPNPCARCNPKIKWGELMKVADERDCAFIATGHYANIREREGRYVLARGRDITKDQSYFLWRLNQEKLSRTIFPLGEIEKSRTREIANDFNLKVHSKPESQEICFIPNDDYRAFLTDSVGYFGKTIEEGDIVLKGKVIGRHKGFPFYTIGQRKGLGVSHSEPLYVKRIDAERNAIEVVEEKDLHFRGLIAESANFVSKPEFEPNKKYVVKIRYRDSGTLAECVRVSENSFRIDFVEKKKSIAPGQSAVVYDGDEVVAGGVISEAF